MCLYAAAEKDRVNVKRESRSLDCARMASSRFWFAETIAVLHAQAYHCSTKVSQRMDFLWVRWLGAEPDDNDSARSLGLTRVGFVPDIPDQIPFGFVDPAKVIRGCHLIPDFDAGRTYGLLGPSSVRHDEGDWESFYVNL